MALMEPVMGIVPPEPQKAPADIDRKLARGRSRMQQDSALRNECMEFWRGNQYVFRSKDNKLVAQATAIGAAGKPRHRIRQVRNMLTDVVEREVSAATQRVPAYEISPSTTDPEDVGAARLSEKVANYGFDKWGIRSVTERVVTYAVVADEGFAWPYFDTSVGSPIADGVYTGEVRIRVLGPNEVYWEPGVRFEDSRWHAVEQARALDEVYAMRGYVGGTLSPDADTSDVSNAPKGATQMVLVTEYLERPSRTFPFGRRFVMANGRVIAPVEPYPCVDPKGEPVDEPVLHKLSYIVDPGSDRDMGLVRHLLDAQRTVNDTVNKELEWKNLALAPQLLAPVGSLLQRITDEPGAVFEYNPVGGQVPQWRPVPQIPGDLARLRDEAKNDILSIASQADIPQGVESGKAIAVINERNDTRRQRFINSLAEFHSRLMRHCLYLVQRHYTEARLLKIKGRFGPETVRDFMGAQLRGQADVTVLPGSIEPRTRQAIEQKVMWIVQTFPGFVSPEAALAAIDGGTAEKLIESYELDVARANMVIQKIKDGPEYLFNVAPRPDGTPGWMPRKFDNVSIHKSVLEDWMKTQEFDSLPPEMREAAELYYDGLEQLEAKQQAQAAQQQQAMAQGLGMANAAKTPAPTPMPSLPAVA